MTTNEKGTVNHGPLFALLHSGLLVRCLTQLLNSSALSSIPFSSWPTDKEQRKPSLAAMGEMNEPERHDNSKGAADCDSGVRQNLPQRDCEPESLASLSQDVYRLCR